MILTDCFEPEARMIEATLRDAIKIVHHVTKHKVVAGGGSIEMELSKKLRDLAKTAGTEMKPLIEAIADAIEIIPRQLCDNANLNATQILEDLRVKHKENGNC